ncbi:hypothetical protein KAR34_03390 [bacterium]|nr:hypothetical protein [bacterium]
MITVEHKQISMVLPAVVIKRKRLIWLLQQKYPQGIIQIDEQRIKLPPVIPRKTSGARCVRRQTVKSFASPCAPKEYAVNTTPCSANLAETGAILPEA